MARFGLIGGSYKSQSPNVDDGQTMNWYVEVVEGQGQSAAVLYPTPGISAFATSTETPERGEITIQGRTFAVFGSGFFEVASDGTLTRYGTILNDDKRCSMTAGPTQVLFCSAGSVYVFDFTTNTFTPLPASDFNDSKVSFVGYCDGFFLALYSNSNEFQVSGLLDATSWDLTQVAKVSRFPDNVLSMLVDHDYVWMWGGYQSVVYYDSGNLFPFDVLPGAFIEQGISAPLSPVKLDNSVVWLGGDPRGQAIAWRANGFTPVRISTHATEYAWQGYILKYGTIADTVGYSYQDQGHSFWVLYFPQANATWVFDAATNLWAERGHWNATNGIFTAHQSWGHTFNFGKHLVGDPFSGKMYEMAINIYDDNGSPLRRVRRSAPIAVEGDWIFHHQLQVDVETGLGPQPPLLDGGGLPRDPMLNIRWSDDGGHKWSNELSVACGQAGQYRKRAMVYRLGRSRERIYEISASDPIPWRIIEGYLQASPGFNYSERIPAQYRKVT